MNSYREGTLHRIQNTYVMFAMNMEKPHLKCKIHQPKSKKQTRWPASQCVDTVISALDNGILEDSDMVKLSKALGRSQNKLVFDDSSTICQQYKNDDFLKTLNLKDWLSKRNSSLIHFLEGIAGNDVATISLFQCIKHIYHLRNAKFISPLAFSKNLLMFYKTGSKGSVLVNSAGSPSGSYTTLQNWIKIYSKQFRTCAVLQRKWRVQSHFKSQTSVITMLAHIFPDQSSKLQERTDLSPKHWFKIDRQSKETAKQKILTDFDKQDEIFREFRNQFIVRQMEIVWKQHEHGTDQLTDLLDKDDYQGATFEIKKEERYNFVSSKHPEEKVNVTVGDPCFENPCSYESVEKVFDHIRDLTGLTDNSKVRQWTMLGCDGLPYTLGSRTIENVSVCQDCKMEFDEEANFKDHIKQNDHCKELSANDCRKYNNIVMIPGLGHYEINMVKVLIKLLWDIAVFDLAKMLGFHSPKALQSFQNAGDHHKSWQSLMIFMHSMAQELLVPYCRQEVKKNANPSLTGYFSYLNGATSSNYKFMSEVVFTYCLALHVFRAGIRRDNSTAIQAGKVKFSPLFFGFNMPFYMETFIRDSFVRVQCPPEVLAFIGANESYSASGHDSKREGGDFVLENINRKSKMWMPSGLPDKKKWLEVYCNIDRLDEVQDHMYNIQHLQPADDEYIFSYDLSEEIFNFLKIVRNSSYFDQRELTTLRGKPLDQELLNFINKSRAHRNDFLSQVVENNLATKKKYEPLFIKPTDRNEYFDISRRTKADIVKAVELELEGLDDEKFNKRWTKIKGKNKTDLLSFLKEIEDIKTADNSA